MPETVDPETGEILQSEVIAADGNRVYPAARCLTDLIAMLGDGAFNASTATDLGQFAEKLEDLGISSDKKVKGKITLSITVEREAEGLFFFSPELKFTTPTEKHPRSVGWVDENGAFTPNRPRQGMLFGTIREVGGTQQTRTRGV